MSLPQGTKKKTKDSTAMNRFTLKLILGVSCMLMMVTSCDKLIYEDLLPCDLGMWFNYSYNMSFVNLFETQTKQLDVFVFDEKGKFVAVFKEAKEEFTHDYTMSLPLDPGQYTCVAYAGLDNNFAPVNLTPGISVIEDLRIRVNRTAQQTIETEFQPLLYGICKDIEVTGAYGHTVEMPMMKMTRKIRIVFQEQNENRSQIDVNHFKFEITAANGTYDGHNAMLNDDTLYYQPYYAENLPGGGAAVELNTLRLLEDGNYRLKITNGVSNETLFDVDLINLLLATKFYENNAMSNQEYLDRQDKYTLVFIFNGQPVTKEVLMSIAIWINGWLIREQQVDN